MSDAVWDEAKALLGNERITLGPYFSHMVAKTPRRLLHLLSYYKFAARMIGPARRVLEVGCSEGLGTLLLAESAEYCLGIDTDADAIAHAKESLRHGVHGHLAFVTTALEDMRAIRFDAVVCLDTIEHVAPEAEGAFIADLARLAEDIAIIGTPNIEAAKWANRHSLAGHINLFDHERFRAALEREFRRVFLFGANDEVVHTGFLPMAHYLLALCVK